MKEYIPHEYAYLLNESAKLLLNFFDRFLVAIIEDQKQDFFWKFRAEKKINDYILSFDEKEKRIGDVWSNSQKIEYVLYLFSLYENKDISELDIGSSEKIAKCDIEYKLCRLHEGELHIVCVDVCVGLYVVIHDIALLHSKKSA